MPSSPLLRTFKANAMRMLLESLEEMPSIHTSISSSYSFQGERKDLARSNANLRYGSSTKSVSILIERIVVESTVKYHVVRVFDAVKSYRESMDLVRVFLHRNVDLN